MSLTILQAFQPESYLFAAESNDERYKSSFLAHLEGSEDTRTVIDMFGRQVMIPDSVESVVGTGPGALRYIVYMNGTDKVVGVENIELDEQTDPNVELRPYNLANPELRDLPSIGPIFGGDSELIVAADPDVVITTNYDQAGDIDDLQTSLGIPVIGLVYGDLIANINILWEGLNITSRVLGTYTEIFLSFKSYLENTIDDLDARTSSVDPADNKTCYVGGIGYRGTHGIASTKPYYDPFELVNANNLAREIGGTHAFVDPEQILAWDPEILFIDGGGFALMLQDLRSGVYNTLQAVNNDLIYVLLPYNWYSANFANILIDAYYLGTILFPDQFSDVNLNETAAEIYENFVGNDVYDTIMENFKKSAQTKQSALARFTIDLGDKPGIPSYPISLISLVLMGTLVSIAYLMQKKKIMNLG